MQNPSGSRLGLILSTLLLGFSSPVLAQSTCRPATDRTVVMIMGWVTALATATDSSAVSDRAALGVPASTADSVLPMSVTSTQCATLGKYWADFLGLDAEASRNIAAVRIQSRYFVIDPSYHSGQFLRLAVIQRDVYSNYSLVVNVLF
jgi:hypothetical protein